MTDPQRPNEVDISPLLELIPEKIRADVTRWVRALQVIAAILTFVLPLGTQAQVWALTANVVLGQIGLAITRGVVTPTHRVAVDVRELAPGESVVVTKEVPDDVVGISKPPEPVVKVVPLPIAGGPDDEVPPIGAP